MAHGDRRTYATGCRCDDCREAASEYQRQYRLRMKRKMDAGEVYPTHGTQYTYNKFMCRCHLCRIAATDARTYLKRAAK